MTSLLNAAVGAAVSTAFAAAYLDAKHDIVNDWRKIRDARHINNIMQQHTIEDRRTLYSFFEDAVNKWPHNDFLVYETETLTYSQVDKRINKVANWLLSQGIKRGDYLCMNIHNTPSHTIWWFACLAIGVIPSFINFNQNGQVLKHSISVADPVMIVFDIAIEDNMSTVSDELKAEGYRIVRFIDNYPPPGPPIEKKITGIDELHQDHLKNETPIDPAVRKGVTWNTPSALIYTSGTTGMPKGAVCAHGKMSRGAMLWASKINLQSTDRILSCLPLYHSTGATLLVAPPIMRGCAVIIVRKFSATRFFDDARKYRATTAHYIGEIPRYILSTPPKPNDKDHNIRLISGNGMRPDVWVAFQERFGISQVHELFGATEGTVSLVNNNFGGPYGVGALDKRGTYLRHTQKDDILLIKIDQDTEEPVRDSNGLCIRATEGEPGELISRIVRGSINNYLGYHKSDSATNKKILRDVLKKGDEYFRFGDLMKTEGHFTYFVDRLGDTFRWRSENVSTTEVQGVLDSIAEEVNVYGVQLPAHDGRCGCFAIPSYQWEKLDTRKLAEHVIKNLPIYARPIFVRVVERSELTATNKLQKVKLRKEGVDPNSITDPIYWLKDGNYVPFTTNDWNSVAGGKVKL